MSSTTWERGRKTWHVNQIGHIARLRERICDDRFGSFIATIHDVARGAATTRFCPSCRASIINHRTAIFDAHGRTYRELTTYTLAALEDSLCKSCIASFSNIPCMHMGIDCPSMSVPFDLASIHDYIPVKRGGRHEHREHGEWAVPPPPPPPTPQPQTPITRPFASHVPMTQLAAIFANVELINAGPLWIATSCEAGGDFDVNYVCIGDGLLTAAL